MNSNSKYEIGFKPRAIKDLSKLPETVQTRIVKQIERMKIGLRGDVRKLTAYTPEYRLRVGGLQNSV